MAEISLQLRSGWRIEAGTQLDMSCIIEDFQGPPTMFEECGVVKCELIT
jgi:hypothetical protein